MRNISFQLTMRQFLDRSKRVTRRLGWVNLKPGTRLMGVEKSQGLGKGGKIKRLGVIEVVSVSRQRLKEITQLDCELEGFPDLTPEQFVAMFCEHMKCTPSTFVTRIEFKYIDNKKGSSREAARPHPKAQRSTRGPQQRTLF